MKILFFFLLIGVTLSFLLYDSYTIGALFVAVIVTSLVVAWLRS